jgi:hypothetical protein
MMFSLNSELFFLSIQMISNTNIGHVHTCNVYIYICMPMCMCIYWCIWVCMCLYCSWLQLLLNEVNKNYQTLLCEIVAKSHSFIFKKLKFIIKIIMN